jgi:sensor histidine kinase YesM
MMRLLKLQFTFFLLLLLSSVKVNGETVPDSLTRVLSSISLPDTSRINTTIALSKELKDNNVPLAFKYAQEAYQSSIAIDYQDGVAQAASMLGLCYLNFGDSRKALSYYFKALEIFIRLNNKRRIAYSYNNIGSVYSRVKNYEKAKFFYQKSLDVKLQNAMTKEASSSYINLGNIAMYQHNLDLCIHYYKQGLSNALHYNDEQNITIGMMNLGEAYFDKKELTKAINFYDKALKRLKIKENKVSEAQAYFALGKIFDNLKQYSVSEEHFHHALALNSINKNRQLELNIYKYLSQMLEHKGDIEQALLFNKKFISLNDSVYNEEIAKNINEMQSLFELKEKEEQIKLLNKENELILTNKGKDDLLRNFLLVGILLTSIITLLLFRSISRKQKTNRLLNIKTKQIEWQRQEIENKNYILAEFNKELLKENVVARYETLKSKIDPHFLFNSLSTLSALIIKEPKTALEFVSKFSKLYRSIMEHGNGNLVTISEELQVLDNYVYLKKMRFGDAIQLTINIPPHNNIELIPPFALQLLVENAIKHNFISETKPLLIDITYNNLTLQVINNIQPRTIPAPSSGLGQQSIMERYQFVSNIAPQFYTEGENYIAIIPTLTLQPKLV